MKISTVFFTIILCTIQSIANSAPIIFNDNFNNGDLSHWSILGGQWDIQDGTLHQTATSVNYTHTNPAQLIQLNGQHGSHFLFQTELGASNIPIGRSAVGIAFGIQDTANFYTMHLFPGFPGGALRFTKFENGQYSNISGGNTNIAFTPSVGEKYSMRVEGANHQFTASVWNSTNFDSAPIFSQSYTDNTFTGGSAGLWSQIGAGYFDNVSTSYQENPVSTIAEPTSLMLLSLGIIGFVRYRKRESLVFFA